MYSLLMACMSKISLKKKITEIAFLAAMFYFILTKAVLVC